MMLLAAKNSAHKGRKATVFEANGSGLVVDKKSLRTYVCFARSGCSGRPAAGFLGSQLELGLASLFNTLSELEVISLCETSF